MFIKKISIKDALEAYGNKITVLIPADNDSVEIYKKLPVNEMLLADIKYNRKYKHLQKYWVVLQNCIDAGITGQIENKYNIKFFERQDKTELNNFLKWCLLPHEFIKTPKGAFETWSSISFEKMPSQFNFDEYYAQAINLLCEIMECGIEKLENL